MESSPDVKAVTLSPQRGWERTPPRPTSPALNDTNSSAKGTPLQATASLNLDMSLPSAVSALVHHLVQPLAARYPHKQLMVLRKRLTDLFTESFRPSWNESNPHSGSGTRSLISDRVLGLPPILRKAAGTEFDLTVWAKAIAATRRRKSENEGEEAEWEVWCDPGMVVWRWGGWGWDEVEFDPIKRTRGEYSSSRLDLTVESFQVIWQAAPAAPSSEVTSPPASTTPLRQSKAIPIRAPTLVNIPPTPSTPTSITQSMAALTTRSPSPGLLPAVDLSSPRSQGHKRTTESRDYGSISLSQFRPNGHKGTDSTSSHSSDSSDTNTNTQLLTPASRPGSADLFPEHNGEASLKRDEEETPRGERETTPEDHPSRRGTPVTTPSVIPYDGGNVTVLGGGTKLGGSRPPSSMGSRHDRTRSPSVSIASRALSNAVGPNSNGGASSPGSPRKHRPRRRIMPTHLGYFGQPGIGAPVMGAFGMQSIKTGQPGFAWPHGGGVGVGIAPPASSVALANQMGMTVGGIQRMAS